MVNLTCIKDERDLSNLTLNKIVNGLMLWTHEGGPWFPPREVRHLALNTCGVLFPTGHATRSLVNYVFKAFNPCNLMNKMLGFVQSTCCCRRGGKKRNNNLKNKNWHD